ncbi:hypothetical protein COO92_00085 [Thalassospira lohafexi]|uniref:Uncharacterized protein n=1 Tax=Thalassospira lohafexi TaxID=744227 RepID=A0A2N3LAR1_9PROT|nr:hypothetical protein COO92_00085 [Thalassospira lohafexi]
MTLRSNFGESNLLQMVLDQTYDKAAWGTRDFGIIANRANTAHFKIGRWQRYRVYETAVPIVALSKVLPPCGVVYEIASKYL